MDWFFVAPYPTPKFLCRNLILNVVVDGEFGGRLGMKVGPS